MRGVIISVVTIQYSLSKAVGNPFHKLFESQLLSSLKKPFVSSVALHFLKKKIRYIWLFTQIIVNQHICSSVKPDVHGVLQKAAF